MPGTFLTRTDTLKAKRLIGVKAQPKVEIIPNIMAVSNLNIKQKPEPVPNRRNSGGGDGKQPLPGGKPTIIPSMNSGNVKRQAPSIGDNHRNSNTNPAVPRPVQVLPSATGSMMSADGPPSSMGPGAAAGLNLPRPTAQNLGMSSESISSHTSSEDSGEIGPSRYPPRRDEVEVRQRTPSMTEDCLYDVHTEYISNIPDGLTIREGQRLKVG